MVLQCRFSFIRLFFRGWKTISIFNNGWFFSCNHGYHVSIFSKIDCNDFSFFRMENLNKDIFWSRFVFKIVAWSAVPGRNRTIAECIARFCIFICTFQINKYLSCNSPAGCIDLGLIFGISKGNLSSMQTSSEPCFS